jgi:hypothetical protein
MCHIGRPTYNSSHNQKKRVPGKLSYTTHHTEPRGASDGRPQTTPLRVGKKEPRRACRCLGPKTFGSIAQYRYVFHSSTFTAAEF